MKPLLVIPGVGAGKGILFNTRAFHLMKGTWTYRTMSRETKEHTLLLVPSCAARH